MLCHCPQRKGPAVICHALGHEVVEEEPCATVTVVCASSPARGVARQCLVGRSLDQMPWLCGVLGGSHSASVLRMSPHLPCSGFSTFGLRYRIAYGPQWKCLHFQVESGSEFHVEIAIEGKWCRENEVIL